MVARLAPSYERGQLTNGPLVRQLEEETAAWLGVPHVVAVSSCTAGLMVSLQALVGDGQGRPRGQGRVVLPSFTFSASAHAVHWNGLQPMFAECDRATAQVDAADVEARLDGADGILATHVFGAPCPVEPLEALARRAGVPLVLDAAHAFGATRRERKVGGFGDAEVFSMTPTKLLVAGEGGLVATRRDDVAAAVRLARDYGNPGDYDTRFPGLNARLSELHAAVALESLRILPVHLERRRAVAAAYAQGLEAVDGIVPQAVDSGDESTYKDFTVRVLPGFGVPRDAVVAALRAEGVDTRCYFSPPVHRQQAYARLEPAPLPVTEALAAEVISLPVFGDLARADADRVVEVLAGLHDHAEAVTAAAR